MTESSTQKKKLYQRRWFQVCGACIVLLPVLFLFALYGVKSYLIDWLEQNGAETAAIEKISLNPFLGRLTVTGVDVQVEGKSLLKNSEMVVDVGFGALFNKNVRVQNALYSGLVLDLEQKEDGSFRIGSYTIESKGEETPVASEPVEQTVSAWAFLADDIALENCLVKLKTPDLDLQLLVEKAALQKFTTREGNSAGTFSIEGKLNEKPIAIDLQKLLVTPSLALKGDVKVSKFQLTEIATLLKDILPVFAGDVELDGTVAFEMGGENGMVVDYAGLIDLVQPDIGSESFGTRAENLKWQGDVHFESVEAKPMLVLTDGLLSAQKYELEVPPADFTTTEAIVELEGKTSVTIGEAVLVENNGRLLIDTSDVLLPGNQIQPELLEWKGEVTYSSNHEGAGQYVATKGTLHLGPLSVKTGEEDAETSIATGDVDWNGDITYGQENEGKTSYVLLGGNLDGAEVRVEIGGETTIAQKAVKLTADSRLSFGDIFDVKGTNSLTLEGFSYGAGEQSPSVTLEKLDIQNFEGSGDNKLRLKELVSAGLSVVVPGNLPLDIQVPGIALSGFATDDMSNFGLGAITVDKPQIMATHNDEELLSLTEIKASEVKLDGSQNVSTAELSLQDFVLLGVEQGAELKPFLTLDNAKLSDIKWSATEGFSGDSLYFTDLVTTVIKDKEGALNISKRLAAMKVNNGTEEEVEEEVVEEKEGEESMPIRLAKVAVTGKSHVRFEDYTLAVPYLTDLAIQQMELTDLDSTRPETKSPFVLKAELEERAPFTVEGDISPFLQPIALGLKIKLKNYPLSRLSSYTVQSVGTALASGQLKLKTKLDLASDTLDMENEVTLKKLETETISPELAAELNNQLPIPLDTALSILRDSDRNISLDIPLSGPVSDLSVGISDVLITALSKAIVPAASGYLMYTLGPYGALAYVGMKVGEKMMKVELPPVEFVAGEIEIVDDHKEYLEKVADILNGRPETDIQLCPQVVSWEFMDEKDIQAVEGNSIETDEGDLEKLTELGQSRAKEVQTYLADEYGIDTSRLLICDTLINTGKEDKPRLMLNL